MSEHTPGPWFWIGTPKYLDGGQSRPGHPTITIASNAHTEEIATVWTYLLPTEANARLIAAAPELLEALQGCVGMLREYEGGDSHFVATAEAVIAKATSEQVPS